MTIKQLGNSDLEISPIGLGTWAIVGARDADQVDGFIGAMDFRLSDDDLADIDAALPESTTLM